MNRIDDFMAIKAKKSFLIAQIIVLKPFNQSVDYICPENIKVFKVSLFFHFSSI